MAQPLVNPLAALVELVDNMLPEFHLSETNKSCQVRCWMVRVLGKNEKKYIVHFMPFNRQGRRGNFTQKGGWMAKNRRKTGKGERGEERLRKMTVKIKRGDIVTGKHGKGRRKEYEEDMDSN